MIKIESGTYLTLREAADRRKVQPRTVKYWIDKGWLPAVVIPSAAGERPVTFLVLESDLDAFTPPLPGAKARER